MPGSRLSISAVAADTLAIYRSRVWGLLAIALVAAMVPALVEHFGDGALGDILYSVVLTAVSMLATAVFAGSAEELVHSWREGKRDVPLYSLLRRVPRALPLLVAVGFLQGMGTALGLVLFIVPGLVLLSWWAVAGPATVAEGTGVLGALGRSRQLVRGNEYRVLGVVLLAFLAASVVAGLISVVGALVGDHPDETFALALGEAVTLPLEGLAIPVMYWRLREIEAARPAAD